MQVVASRGRVDERNHKHHSSRFPLVYRCVKATLVTWRQNRGFLFCVWTSTTPTEREPGQQTSTGFRFSSIVCKELLATRIG